MAKLVAKRYAEALYELALEEDKMDKFAEDIQVLLQVFRENKELGELMNHPKLDKEEKQQLMRQILKGSVSEEVAGFLQIIIAKDRYMEWEDIFTCFMDLVDSHKCIGKATVTTAIDMNPSQRERIHSRLLKTTQYETMEITYYVNPDIIGGMVIQIGERVVDSSVRTKLSGLTKVLKATQLAV